MTQIKITILFAAIFFTAPFYTNAQEFSKKDRKKMVSISPLASEVKIKKGEKAYYSGSVHGSVGETVHLFGQDSRVLDFITSDFVYDDPKKAKMTGGDAGTKYFYYKAKEVGETTITIEERFRGEVRQSFEVKIIVVEE